MKHAVDANYCLRCAAPLEDRTIDGVARRACAAGCGFVHWGNPVPVAAALVQWGDDFVLARNAAWPTGVFSVISGFLEPGETPESALRRETREELGLQGQDCGFIGHYIVPDANLLMIGFHVHATGTLTLSDEIAETKVVNRAALRAYEFGRLALTQQLVADWFGGRQNHG